MTFKDMLINKIRFAKHNWVVQDPYPQYSEAKSFNATLAENSKISSLLGLGKKEVPDISPQKAWSDGFTFAWKLVDQALNRIASEPEYAKDQYIAMQKSALIKIRARLVDEDDTESDKLIKEIDELILLEYGL